MKVSSFLLGFGILGVVGASHPSLSAPAAKKAPKVTYAENVAPILNRSCVSCHRPGEVAPFSLIGYENARKWAATNAAVAESRKMPPWKATHGYGDFLDENRLTEEEIATLKAWNDVGAPRGNRRKEPKPPTFPNSSWSLGEPDMIVAPTKPFKLDAEGDDVYRNFVIRNDFKEAKWIQAMDVQPGNKKIVHHVILYLDRSDQAQKLAEKSNDGQEGYSNDGGGTGFIPSGSLGGWAPGLRARRSSEGIAFKLDPGTTMVMQVHYHKSGKPETDLTKIGLYFAKEPIKKELDLNWIFNFNVNIPPGDKNYHLRREFTYGYDATVYGAMPHMHLLGRKMKSWFVFPDGTTKPLIEINDWDFKWQLSYILKEPLKIPKGTKQIVEADYDNSPENPRNPNDPPKRVTWGEQTTDEMFLLIVPYTKD